MARFRSFSDTGPARTGITLSLCLGASQSALLVLSPILADVATDLGVSTATAGQLRTISGLTAGVTALTAGRFAARTGLRELLAMGLVLLAAAAAVSAVSPSFTVLVAAQGVLGIGVGLTRLRSPPRPSGARRPIARACSPWHSSARRSPGSWACRSPVPSAT